MKELIQNYSLKDIILFIVILAAAIKGIVSWYEWAVGKISTKVHKEDRYSLLQAEITKLIESQKQTNDTVGEMAKTLQVLVDSDKDDIKAFITQQHHHFCYKVGYIDDYSLDCIEKRYKHYKDEGGNSFIADFMSEIRSLPKKSILDFKEENLK